MHVRFQESGFVGGLVHGRFVVTMWHDHVQYFESFGYPNMETAVHFKKYAHYFCNNLDKTAHVGLDDVLKLRVQDNVNGVLVGNCLGIIVSIEIILSKSGFGDTVILPSEFSGWGMPKSKSGRLTYSSELWCSSVVLPILVSLTSDMISSSLDMLLGGSCGTCGVR